MRKRLSVAAMVVIAAMLIVPSVLAATTSVVTPDTTDWYVHTQRVDGAFEYVEGPDSPPAGVGSLELSAPNLSTDKITYATDVHLGTPLADLAGIVYSTYRAGSSTAPSDIIPSINVFITNGGPDGSVEWAPLVWEATYPFPGQVDVDTWQSWDTTAASESGFEGGWWSTRTLGTICEFNCFVDWETMLEQNPHAVILEVGVNLGTGPAGSFVGAVDAYTLDFADGTVVYDFELEEPVAEPEQPTSKDDCKKGGWQEFGFKNQGQCIKFVNTGKDSR